MPTSFKLCGHVLGVFIMYKIHESWDKLFREIYESGEWQENILYRNCVLSLQNFYHKCDWDLEHINKYSTFKCLQLTGSHLTTANKNCVDESWRSQMTQNTETRIWKSILYGINTSLEIGSYRETLSDLGLQFSSNRQSQIFPFRNQKSCMKQKTAIEEFASSLC